MMSLQRCILLPTLIVAWGAAPAPAQWVITPYLGVNVSGDVEQGKGGPGASVDYLGGRFGFAFDFQRYQHFFKDSDISPLDSAATPNCTEAVTEAAARCLDIDTDAMSFMGNMMVPVRTQAASKWRPYGTAGLGLIRAWTNQENSDQNNFGFNVGGGLTYSLSRRVGLRGDLRYFRALVDENKRDGVYFRDYGFLRASLGVTYAFPR
jgi:opacity protein-like surface antigen